MECGVTNCPGGMTHQQSLLGAQSLSVGQGGVVKLHSLPKGEGLHDKEEWFAGIRASVQLFYQYRGQIAK